MRLSLGRKANGSGNWTSVVFSAGRIDIAEVVCRTDEKPKLLLCESFAREGSDLEALKRLRKHLQGRCTTLLGYGKYQMLAVDAPQATPEEWQQALRWKVKDMVDFPIDQAGVSGVRIPLPEGAGGRGPQALAVVASHVELTPTIRLFQDAKVDLQCIDVSEMAQRNLARLVEQENRALAMLLFAESGGTLTFTSGGELLATRHVDVKLKDLATAQGEARSGLYERVLLDVQRSLDNFDRNFSFVTLAELLVTPVVGAEGFVEYLQSNLYQKVGVFDLARGMDIGTCAADVAGQPEALLAVGAALRKDG